MLTSPKLPQNFEEVAHSPSVRSQILFVIDFDGTVAPEDTVDALLESFAHSEWRDVEEQWARGVIDSRQCMATQIGLLRPGQAAIEDFLKRVAIDPDFFEFIAHVREFADVAIVSDGLDYTIQHAVREVTPPIPVFANRLEFDSAGASLSFPYSDGACRVRSGVCKCAVARSLDAGRGLTTILIGDGQSDQCVAGAVDYVFAKSSLRRYCEERSIVYTPFETFADVLSVVRRWSAQNSPFLRRQHVY